MLFFFSIKKAGKRRDVICTDGVSVRASQVNTLALSTSLLPFPSSLHLDTERPDRDRRHGRERCGGMSGISLTPIRVRGKKKHKSAGPEAATATGPGTATGSAPRTAGRRLLSLAERSQSLQNRRSRQHKRTRLNATVPRNGKTSQLERLPVELLEKIFIYSLNANFAHASPYLAAAVSSERIYRLLILIAFSWDGPVTSGVERILRYDSAPVVDDRTALQEDILRCRWCTAERVQRLLPELSRLAVQRFWVDEGGGSEQHTSLDYPDGSVHGTLHDQPCTLSLTPTPTSLTIAGPTTTTTKPIINLRAIPSPVLASIPLLEVLRTSGGLTPQDTDPEHMRTVAQTVRVSRTLQAAIRRAVATANRQALQPLLELDEYIARCENVARPPPTETIPYTVPGELFRAATRHPLHTAVEIMAVLLRANAESVPDDAEITAFAMECSAHHVRLGAWLLDFLLDLPRQRDLARQDPTRGLFYLGRPTRVVDWD